MELHRGESGHIVREHLADAGGPFMVDEPKVGIRIGSKLMEKLGWRGRERLRVGPQRPAGAGEAREDEPDCDANAPTQKKVSVASRQASNEAD